MKNLLLKKGFTLIELLVVVLIIGILAAIAVPKYQLAVLKSKYARAVQTASDLRKAYELYYLQHGVYPTKFSDLDFANKFPNSDTMRTEDYSCFFDNTYHEISCNIDNNKIRYYINFYTWDSKKITTLCRPATTNKSDITHKVCQQETGKTESQAYCSNNGYCNYFYD